MALLPPPAKVSAASLGAALPITVEKFLMRLANKSDQRIEMEITFMCGKARADCLYGQLLETLSPRLKGLKSPVPFRRHLTWISRVSCVGSAIPAPDGAETIALLKLRRRSRTPESPVNPETHPVPCAAVPSYKPPVPALFRTSP